MYFKNITFILLYLGSIAYSIPNADALLADKLFEQGVLKQKNANYDSAAYLFEKSGKLYGLQTNWERFVRSYTKAGENFIYLSKFQQAIYCLEKGLNVGNRHLNKDNVNLSYNQNVIGWYYYGIGDYERAITFFQKALNLYLKINGKNFPKVAQGYNNIAGCYESKGEYDKAMSYYQKALKIRKSTGGFGLAQTLNDLGWLHGRKQNFEKQLINYKQAKNLFIKLLGTNHPHIGRCYNNIGEAYKNLGDDLQALYYFKKGLAIKQKAFGEKHPDISKSYLSIGNFYAANKKWEKALASYQEALLASIYAFQDTNVFVLPPLENTASKIVLLDILKAKAQAFNQVYYFQGNQKKNLIAAFENFQLALRLIDLLRFEFVAKASKSELLAKSTTLYDGAIQSAYQLYQITQAKKYLDYAFTFAEKSKAFLMLERMQDLDAKHFAGIPDSLLTKERELKIDITSYEKTLFNARNKKDSGKIILSQNYLFDYRRQFDSLISQLEKNYPIYHQLKYDSRVASVKDIQENIEVNTTFIEYFMGDSSLYIFVIAKNDFKMHEYKHVDKLNEQVKIFRQMLIKPPLYKKFNKTNWQRYHKIAFNIFQGILSKPLNDLNNLPNHLIIVPDGILHYLPFETLLSEASSKAPSYKNLHYLIKQYQFSYSYSGTFLLKNNKRATNIDKINCLAFAPAYPGMPNEFANRGRKGILRGEELVNLPGAQMEVKAISQYFEGEYFLGKIASEKQFKQKSSNYAILHLSMHGDDNDEYPLYSRLFFANTKDSNEDDTLYTYELYNMRLNANLAVLSACQTGSGKLVRGEGVMSLARGFMYAGCKSVIQTLWKSHDWASAKLMNSFYANLSDNQDIDEALRNSKIEYLNNASELEAHPFFWSAYVLSGNYKSIKSKKINLWDYTYLILGVLIILLLLYCLKRKT